MKGPKVFFCFLEFSYKTCRNSSNFSWDGGWVRVERIREGVISQFEDV